MTKLLSALSDHVRIYTVSQKMHQYGLKDDQKS